jgi:hypothetical protein
VFQRGTAVQNWGCFVKLLGPANPIKAFFVVFFGGRANFMLVPKIYIAQHASHVAFQS